MKKIRHDPNEYRGHSVKPLIYYVPRGKVIVQGPHVSG